jgi:cation transport ATPase
MNMQPDFNTFSYRLHSIEKQLVTLQSQIEKQLGAFQSQMHQYVPVRENELQLNTIQESVRGIKGDVSEIKQQVNEMSQKLIEQDKVSRERDSIQRETQDKAKIRMLWFFVSTVISMFVAIAIALVIFYIENR